MNSFRNEGTLVNHIYLNFCCYIFLEYFWLYIILLFVRGIATLKKMTSYSIIVIDWVEDQDVCWSYPSNITLFLKKKCYEPHHFSYLATPLNQWIKQPFPDSFISFLQISSLSLTLNVSAMNSILFSVPIIALISLLFLCSSINVKPSHMCSF